MQAAYRGFRCRQAVHKFRDSVKFPHPYFSAAELRETLSRRRAQTRSKVQPKYRYAHGGTYKGEWLGGFRHGYGVLEFPSSSVYEGEWHYGLPLGYGKFSHYDGECFEGHFRKYFLGPQDLFRSARSKEAVTDGYGKA